MEKQQSQQPAPPFSFQILAPASQLRSLVPWAVSPSVQQTDAGPENEDNDDIYGRLTEVVADQTLPAALAAALALPATLGPENEGNGDIYGRPTEVVADPTLPAALALPATLGPENEDNDDIHGRLTEVVADQTLPAALAAALEVARAAEAPAAQPEAEDGVGETVEEIDTELSQLGDADVSELSEPTTELECELIHLTHGSSSGSGHVTEAVTDATLAAKLAPAAALAVGNSFAAPLAFFDPLDHAIDLLIDEELADAGEWV
jgi:hypothetical protein